ncbi:MAG: RNA methyltransferase [Alphaproteobacteria bacterium]|nr:RNA methyltransferase [Alphaproteobacteria bacterium]
MIVSVTTTSDPRLAPYAAVKDRDLARRDGRFIVEGRVTLQRLIEASRFPVESLFLSETRLKPLAPLLWKLDPSIPVYAAPQSVMDGITGFHLHRGVLAVARRQGEAGCAELVSSLATPSVPLTLLALIGLSNHDNVGACFRNAEALGADAVLLDETSCDPLYRKSIRVSAGTALSLPFARSGSGADLVAQLQAEGIETWALTPQGGDPMQALEPPERLAIVVGAEGPGLPGDLMNRMRRVSIPMARGVDSLNVAAAGAIALSHVYSARQRRCAQA